MITPGTMFQALFRFFKLQAPPSQQRLAASTFVESESPLAASVMQSPLYDPPMRLPSPPVPFTRRNELESLMKERALSTRVSDSEKTSWISYLEAHGQTDPAFEDIKILAEANKFRSNLWTALQNIGNLVDHLNRIDDRRKEDLLNKVTADDSQVPIVYLIAVATNSYLWNLDTDVDQSQKESTLRLLLSFYVDTINQELTREEKGYIRSLASIEEYEKNDPILLIDVVLDMMIDKIDRYKKASSNEREEFIIDLFARSGAEVDQIKSNEDTPLHRLVDKLFIPFYAAKLEPRIIRVLKKVLNEDNINHRGKDGDTLLLLAIKAGRYELAKELLERMADPALQDRQGNTAAHILILFSTQDIDRWYPLYNLLLKTDDEREHDRIMRLTNNDGVRLGDLVDELQQIEDRV